MVRTPTLGQVTKKWQVTNPTPGLPSGTFVSHQVAAPCPHPKHPGTHLVCHLEVMSLSQVPMVKMSPPSTLGSASTKVGVALHWSLRGCVCLPSGTRTPG